MPNSYWICLFHVSAKIDLKEKVVSKDGKQVLKIFLSITIITIQKILKLNVKLLLNLFTLCQSKSRYKTVWSYTEYLKRRKTSSKPPPSSPSKDLEGKCDKSHHLSFTKGKNTIARSGRWYEGLHMLLKIHCHISSSIISTNKEY